MEDSSQVYCHGELLHTIQMAHLYEDSKTFVDMKLKVAPEQTVQNFRNLMESEKNQPTETHLREFISKHFDDVGQEFRPWTPKDWVDNPTFLQNIREPALKQWGSELNSIWKELGRHMIEDVHKNPQYYSIIPVDNPVIVPGGRFREFYYWDSYWIVRGLLYSQMFETVRGMLKNFLSLIERLGFIPNGGRIYYKNRSQPPFFAAMVKSYYDFTNDKAFVIDSVKLLDREFQYWMNNHKIQAKGYNMAAYRSTNQGPRPESHREDVESANVFETADEKENCFAELKAAAESGMDFSSRWFINAEGTNTGNLTNLKTRSIIPVELSSLLFLNAKIIADFYKMAGNDSKYEEFSRKAAEMLKAIEAVHWNEEVGVWLDYDTKNDKQRNYFVATNLSPLWMQAYNLSDTEKISSMVLKYINNLKLDSFPGGIPITLYPTGEQWDFPNVWPPVQYMLIEGLDKLGTPEAKKLSSNWCHRWVTSNFKAYNETKAMFEKYNAEKFGGHGGGGEYKVQKGFGWTNGIIIEYLAKYGDSLSLSN